MGAENILAQLVTWDENEEPSPATYPTQPIGLSPSMMLKDFYRSIRSVKLSPQAIKKWRFKADHQRQTLAKFHSSCTLSTDGVFRALTESRVQTPWIEAFRKQQREGQDPAKASQKPVTPANRKLEPKRMSDSYHSVVSGLRA